MPLSEHEQRLLEQMEKALYAEDPKFATSLRSTSVGAASRGRAALGVLGLFAGMGLILAGMAATVIALGVAGFVVMLIGAVITYTAFSTRTVVTVVDEEGNEIPQAAAPQAPPAQGNGFMDRLEDRWRKRAEGGEQ
ncbi:MAG: DUF3040 domain-containing protein [Candidatus Nanopelagicales bacterium]|jgi:hypothetical protein|nr:DUF3040 domain-containing protein [Candidatus Nanopelagicales bacterium]